MDIRQLRYFLAIAEEGTITKAAEKLHMAQPPLSRSLKMMEDELGVILFERNKKKKVELTIQGKLFLEKAKGVIHNLEEAILEVQEYGQEISGTLAIGTTIYSAPLMLSTLKLFRKKYPDVNFSVWEGNSTHLMELLENHTIDIAIAADPIPEDVEAIHSFKQDPCVFIVSKEQASAKEQISVQEIASTSLILLGPSEGNSLYGQIIEEFQRLDVTPSILCECHDSALLLNLVKIGFGATILPLSMVESQFLDNCHIIPIVDNPWVKQSSLIWRKNSYVSSAAKGFIDFFREMNE